MAALWLLLLLLLFMATLGRLLVVSPETHKHTVHCTSNTCAFTLASNSARVFCAGAVAMQRRNAASRRTSCCCGCGCGCGCGHSCSCAVAATSPAVALTRMARHSWVVEPFSRKSRSPTLAIGRKHLADMRTITPNVVKGKKSGLTLESKPQGLS